MPTSTGSALAEIALRLRLSDEEIRQRLWQIQHHILTQSAHVRVPEFTAIHTHDLECLFRAYDERFFGGLCRRALDGRKLSFRLSRRMTNTGGKTTCFLSRAGEIRYEIAVAIGMLFETCCNTDRRVTVCGLECENRIEMLQRIFEHEMLHLTEMLCWGKSDCAALRFQEMASRIFLHRAHTHAMITRRERAAELGIHIGSRVMFTFQGRELTGRVNRITNRATVLVEDANGRQYSDGLRYSVYYVPLRSVKPTI